MARHYMRSPVAEPDPAPVAIAEPESPVYPRSLGDGCQECYCERHDTTFVQIPIPGWERGWFTGQCADCALEEKLRPAAAEELQANQVEIGKRAQEHLGARTEEIEQAVEAILAEEIPARRAELTEWYRNEFADEARTIVATEMHSEILARLVAEAKAKEPKESN